MSMLRPYHLYIGFYLGAGMCKIFVLSITMFSFVACSSAPTVAESPTENSTETSAKVGQVTETQPSDVAQLKAKIDDINNRLYILTEQMDSLRARFKDVDKLPSLPAMQNEKQQKEQIDKFQQVSVAMKNEYLAAYNLFKDGKYAKSLLSFSNFIDKYPNSSLTDNAYFWLGESYFEQREFALAIDEYLKIIKKFPEGSKAPDAMLKIAISYKQLGENNDSNAYLRELISRYPNSRAASTATIKLKETKAKDSKE